MDTLVTIVVMFLVWVWGVIAGWKARESYAKKVVSSLTEEIKEHIKEESKSVVHITIEKHNDVFYVYDKKNHTFMAQGASKEELEDALISRFPGKRFAASEEDLMKAELL